MRAIVSALRPTKNMPSVRIADRNGVENDANTMAIPATMATSITVSDIDDTISKRSPGPIPDVVTPAMNSAAAAGMGTSVARRWLRAATTTATATTAAAL